MSTDQLAALRKDFRIDDKRPEREYYVIACKHCGDRWTLATKPGGINGGNILHLLNHAAGCGPASE